MDQCTSQNSYQAAVEAAFDIVAEATLTRSTVPPLDVPANGYVKFSKSVESKRKVVLLLVIALVMLVTACGTIGNYIESQILVKISAGGVVVLLFVWVLYIFAVRLPQISEFIKFFRTPSKPLLQLVKHALSIEKVYLERLAMVDVNAIQHVLTHFENERNAMEKRGSAFSGAIDRLGLFPALGAVALLYYGLKNFGAPPDLIQMLVSLSVAFHLINFMAIGLYQKTDRVIAMLKCSIAARA